MYNSRESLLWIWVMTEEHLNAVWQRSLNTFYQFKRPPVVLPHLLLKYKQREKGWRRSKYY